MVKNVGLANFNTEVVHADRPVLVDFFATYCGPCRALKPVLDQLDREGHKVVTVDIGEEPELAEHFGVQAVPTLFVFVDGKPRVKTAGLKSKEQLAEMIALGVEESARQQGVAV